MATPATKPQFSVFECRSPLLKGPALPKEPTSVSALTKSIPECNKPYHFLLVDDNIINLRIFSRVLRKLFPKASVRAIQDSLSLELTEELFLRFDCVFLDIDMPLVTGIDIATTLRSFSALDHVGLIAVTTRALPADLELYESIGFDHTFPKPSNATFAQMMAEISQVINVRGALRDGTQAAEAKA